MKLSFSTLACPDWTMPEIVKVAASTGYDGIELRFVEGEDSIWKLPAFSGAALALTKRLIADDGLEICCVDTSCRFHSPDIKERRGWLDEGERMSDLAAELGAGTRSWLAAGVLLAGDDSRVGSFNGAAGGTRDGAATEGAGNMLVTLAIAALMFTASRIASDENSANRTATAAAMQTTARIREEIDRRRRTGKEGEMYSLGCGSPSLSERYRGTSRSPSNSRGGDRRASKGVVR